MSKLIAAANRISQPSAKAAQNSVETGPEISHNTIGIGRQKLSMMKPAALAART